METVFSISFFILLLLMTILFRRSHLRRLSNSPPSSPSLPLLGHLHLLKKPLHQSLAFLSTRYAAQVLSLRFGSRPVLLVSSTSAAADCFTENDLAFANRPRFLAGKHLGYDYTTLVWASHGPHWRNLRRIAAAEIFSPARVHSFSPLLSEEVVAMVKFVDDASRRAAGAAVEMRPRLLELTLNVMMRLVAGRRFCRDGRFQNIVRETFAVSAATNLADFLPLLRWFGCRALEKQLIRLQKERDEFLQELVDERRGEVHDSINSSSLEDELVHGSDHKCLIDVLLSLQRGDPEHYTDEIIKGLIVVLLTAGTDTTALTTEWALALLLSHSGALAEAQAELERVTGNGRLIKECDLPNLPYLHSIIKETLRLHPVAPLIPAHESSEECSLRGYRVPEGTMLLVNAWAIHRDPTVWEEAESFQPERWLLDQGESAEGVRKERRTFSFGMGRRGCPGEGLALRVLSLGLGALLQCFDWDVVGGEAVDLSEGNGLSMPMATPLRAICRQRQILGNYPSH